LEEKKRTGKDEKIKKKIRQNFGGLEILIG